MSLTRKAHLKCESEKKKPEDCNKNYLKSECEGLKKNPKSAANLP